MPEPTRPVFTQSMTMHLNGGSTYSELQFAVYRNGVKTPITRLTRTDGRPKYTKTVDVLVCGNEVFDIMETKGVGMMEWLIAHSEPKGENNAESMAET